MSAFTTYHRRSDRLRHRDVTLYCVMRANKSFDHKLSSQSAPRDKRRKIWRRNVSPHVRCDVKSGKGGKQANEVLAKTFVKTKWLSQRAGCRSTPNPVWGLNHAKQGDTPNGGCSKKSAAPWFLSSFEAALLTISIKAKVLYFDIFIWIKVFTSCECRVTEKSENWLWDALRIICLKNMGNNPR